MMEPRIEIISAKKLIGKNILMSLVENKTAELWKSFMSQRNEIKNTLSLDLISMQVYAPSHFIEFNPSNEFEKWACAEVSNFDILPAGMQTFTLEGGRYAVFEYKGSSADPSIFQYIYGVWLPKSMYELDHRPHFEVLGAKYKNNDPNSEEEIWIPIKVK